MYALCHVMYDEINGNIYKCVCDNLIIKRW